MRGLLVGLSVAASLTTLAPWGASGERARSSYELVDVAGRSGVLPERLDELAPVWYLIPALCGVVILLGVFTRDAFVGLAAAVLGLLVAAGGLLVVRSPLVTEPGAVAGLVAGAATVAIAGAAIARGWYSSRS